MVLVSLDERARDDGKNVPTESYLLALLGEHLFSCCCEAFGTASYRQEIDNISLQLLDISHSYLMDIIMERERERVHTSLADM